MTYTIEHKLEALMVLRMRLHTAVQKRDQLNETIAWLRKEIAYLEKPHE